MIKRLLCWLFGHRILVKENHGEFVHSSPLAHREMYRSYEGGAMWVDRWEWFILDHCIRCGNPVPEKARATLDFTQTNIP